MSVRIVFCAPAVNWLACAAFCCSLSIVALSARSPLPTTTPSITVLNLYRIKRKSQSQKASSIITTTNNNSEAAAAAAAASPLDPQQVAAAIERVLVLDDDSSDDDEASLNGDDDDDDDSDHDPLPWRSDDAPFPIHGAAAAAEVDDAAEELIAAALDSLEIAPPPHEHEPLPELEFSGEDDPLWQLPPDDDDDSPNLLNVFDDDGDDDDEAILNWDNNSSNHHPSSPLQEHHAASNNDALDLLEQLEHLTLLDDDHIENNSQDHRWLNQEPIHDPTHPETNNNNGNSNSNDDWWWSFCHPCDLPRAEPPPTAENSEQQQHQQQQAWLIAAAAVLAEQEQQQQDFNDDPEAWQFWHEQLQLLRRQQHNSDDNYDIDNNPFELLDFGNSEYDSYAQEEEEDSDTNNTKDKDKSTMQNHTDSQQQQQPTPPPPPPPSAAAPQCSPQALAAARPFVAAFAEKNSNHSKNNNSAPRACLGHRERILGCAVAPCGQLLATASQDSTVRVWDVGTGRHQKLLATLTAHSTQHECLRVAWAGAAWASEQLPGRRRRSFHDGNHGGSSPYNYLLATGGADGVVHLFGCADPFHSISNNDNNNGGGGWTNYATLDHATFHHAKTNANPQKPKEAGASLESIREEDDDDATNPNKEEDDDDEDKPQIYALQFIDHWKALPNDIRHGSNNNNNNSDDPGAAVADDDDDKTTNRGNSFLLTSSDDHVHLWELDRSHKKSKAADGAASRQLRFREVLSLYFGPLQGAGYGVRITSVTQDSILNAGTNNHGREQEQQHDSACPNNNSDNRYRFGGERNPHNLIFVFDAAYCPGNGLLGVALSDGSLRLVNGRGVCMAVLQLPGCQSHLTSLAWGNHNTLGGGGTRLATTVATGHLITWGIETTASGAPDSSSHSLVDSSSSESVRASCLAVMEGGHTPGRPLYGAQFLERDDRLLLSWGSDGRVCLWDGQFQGEIDAPLAVLREDDSYPIFAVAVTDKKKMAETASLKRDDDDEASQQTEEDGNDDDDKRHMLTIAIAGGGPDGGFLGIPVYLQDVFHLPGNDNDTDENEEQKDSKKAKIEER